MASQLQETINLARSLPLAEQRELLNILSVIIQQTDSTDSLDSLENQAPLVENDTDFSAESFRKSWQQAITGRTLPISQLWEGIELD